MLTNEHPLAKKLLKKLKQRLTMPISAYRELGTVTETKDGPVIHIDNGGPVLAVAHLDWVMYRRPHIDRKRFRVHCPQLDDRLGVWVILDLLPTLYGLKYDVLLTDSEECGRSTAKDFKTDKQYNWMFQFDRRGTDTVLYDYDSSENRARLESAGLTTGYGSFSDICYLSHLGISGWNVGTGYYGEHTQKCHADLEETCDNADKFTKFFMEHKDTHIPAPPKRSWGYKSYYSNDGYEPDAWGDTYGGYYDSPSYKKEKSAILKALREKNAIRRSYRDSNAKGFNDPSRKWDEDWMCECGKINFWDRQYCEDCGSYYSEQYPSSGPVDFDEDLIIDDSDWAEGLTEEEPESLSDFVPFETEDLTEVEPDVTIDDWNPNTEGFAEFVLRTGYQGKIIY